MVVETFFLTLITTFIALTNQSSTDFSIRMSNEQRE